MHKSRLDRLNFIVEFLISAPVTFDEIQSSVELKFGANIKERQLRKDIQFLRDEGIDGFPLKIKVKNGQYSISENWGININRLTLNERATIPFLLELIKPYQNISAVKLLWKHLISVESEILDAKNAAESVVFGYPYVDLKEVVLKKIEDFLIAIEKQYAVIFNYTRVQSGAASDSKFKDLNYTEQIIYPMQVRSYMGRFYIVGILCKFNPSPSDIRTFAIDAIGRGPEKYEIDMPIESSKGFKFSDHPPIDFNWDSLAKRTGLINYFSNAIGIFRDYRKHLQPVAVKRWFMGWAANWVVTYPLHSSQQIIKTDECGNIFVQIEVYDTPDLDGLFARFGELCISDDEYRVKILSEDVGL